MNRFLAVASTAVILIAPRPVVGQATCPSGTDPIGHLGISIGCDCTVSPMPATGRPWQIRSPVRVAGIEPGGPADGRLRVGDLIVGVDGLAVTEPDGARRLAGLGPRDAARLDVFRDGRPRTVEITTQAICPLDPRAMGAYAPAPASASEPRSVPRARAPGAATDGMARPSPVPTLPDLLPAGRLGFALACTACGWERAEGDASPRWHSEAPPRVYAVEPDGPAAAAGLEPGDRILEVDGAPITGRGGIALGAARPGVPLRLRVRRNGDVRELTLTPGEREPAPAPRSRYTGAFGGVEVDVRSAAPARVSVSGSGDEMTIVVDGTVVRLRVRN